MRTIIISTGARINVRGLTRREVKNLADDDAINLYLIGPDKAQQAMDAVLELAVSEHDLAELDDLPNADAVKVYRGAMAETFGSRDEEKN